MGGGGGGEGWGGMGGGGQFEAGSVLILNQILGEKNNNTTLKRVMREYIKQQHNIKACYAGV